MAVVTAACCIMPSLPLVLLAAPPPSVEASAAAAAALRIRFSARLRLCCWKLKPDAAAADVGAAAACVEAKGGPWCW